MPEHALPHNSPTLLFCDTETTGLVRPYLRGGRRVWDLGLIRREPDGTENTLQTYIRIADTGLLEQIPTRIALDTTVPLPDRLKAHLPEATQEALAVGDFWDRHPEITEPDNPAPAVVSERQLAELLMSGWLAPGADHEAPTLVADVADFDDLGLFDLLYRHRCITRFEPWHYHKADMGSILGGALRQPPRWNSEEQSRAVGVDPDAYARHTALGDARWNRDRYDAVFHPPTGRDDAQEPAQPAEQETPADAAGEAA